MTTRVAYVELNFWHGEIQPTFWWVARRAGLELDFHVLRDNLVLRPLAGLPEPPRIVPIVAADPHDPCAAPLDATELFEPGRYDLVVLGTAEPVDRVGALERLRVPQLHVHHNPPPLRCARDLATPCVLSPGGRSWFAEPPVVVEPFFLGGPTDPATVDVVPAATTTASPDGPVVVCVPGNVQFARRNYGALVRALVRLRAEGVTPDQLTVRLLGRADAGGTRLHGRMRLNGDRLRAVLDDEGVRDFVELSAHELTYPELYGAAAGSHYVLPLIDECFVGGRPYLRGKATGSLGVGIGVGAVPILNTRHAAAVDISVGPRYRLDDVAAGLRAALDRRRFVEDRAALAALRSERLERSAEAFAAWVERVLVRTTR
ncbi:MAG: hypothetical protein MUF83_05375 [Acidimicrobiales bacterium]|jgi:hypothetical protein|nr:hypothetical protein [Acidimicrobiales bacterium]